MGYRLKTDGINETTLLRLTSVFGDSLDDLAHQQVSMLEGMIRRRQEHLSGKPIPLAEIEGFRELITEHLWHPALTEMSEKIYSDRDLSNRIQKLSKIGDCWSIKSKSTLLDNFLSQLPSITHNWLHSGYPTIFGLRCNSVSIFFLRRVDEVASDTDSVIAACISAYQPDEILLSMQSAPEFVIDDESPPYALIFTSSRISPLTLYFAKCIREENYFVFHKMLGKMSEQVEELNFPHQAAYMEMYAEDGTRTREARRSLIAWRKDINWGFEEVEKNQCPPSIS